MQIKLPPLHSGQRAIKASPARFKVVSCGRRWGKTRLGVWLAISEASKGGRVWWVAPDFQRSNEGFDLLWKLARTIPGATRIKSERRITIGAGMVEVRSADDPDQLRGAGLDFVVIDESAFMREEAWHVLRPALSDRQGRALLISTPRGRNWFFHAFQRGQDPLQPEWASWQAPTASNPHIPASEVDEARLSLPEIVFREEYLAEFIDDNGLVFRGVDSAVYGPLGTYTPDPARVYGMGVDLARYGDFSVLVVVDVAARRVVDFDRFNEVDWPLQRTRIKAMSQRWHVKNPLVESNSIGDGQLSELRNEGVNALPFQTSNESKAQLVKALAYDLEMGSAGLPDVPVLLNELKAFEAQRLPSGVFRYAAPAGQHDDAALACLIAWHTIAHGYQPLPDRQPAQVSKWARFADTPGGDSEDDEPDPRRWQSGATWTGPRHESKFRNKF